MVYLCIMYDNWWEKKEKGMIDEAEGRND